MATNAFLRPSEVIKLPHIQVLFPSANISPPSLLGFVNEENCASLQMNFTATGGSFSISALPGFIPSTISLENFLLSLPFGRVGIVKDVRRTYSTGGILDVVSGPAVPLQAIQINFAAVIHGTSIPASQLATQLLRGNVIWQAFNPFIKQFTYRGLALQGVQQLASIVLGEVFVNRNNVYVMRPGQSLGTPPSGGGSGGSAAGGKGSPIPGSQSAQDPFIFSVPDSDLVNIAQDVDYSLDYPAILNPVLSSVQQNPQGDFVYDQDHARKQSPTVVQCGFPPGPIASDFIPIPDGWMIEGSFDEFAVGTTPTPSNGASRYWKVFPSPTNAGFVRGVLNFTRLVKALNLGPNVSTFVGSPVTAQDINYATANGFSFGALGGTSGGIFGTLCQDDVVNDIVSGQLVSVAGGSSSTIPTLGDPGGVSNSLVLYPPGGTSGPTDAGGGSPQFFSITLGLWTFPRVNPQIFPVGNPANPFNIPNNVNVVTPSSQVSTVAGGASIQDYWNDYLASYRIINSPRLKTSLVCVYRGNLPQPGDSLFLSKTFQNNGVAGRIDSVTINFNRGGITLSISAQVYHYGILAGTILLGTR